MEPPTLILLILSLSLTQSISTLEILSNSELRTCPKFSKSDNTLNCTTKININMAVPSEASGGESSIVAALVEVEGNSSHNMQTLRKPPVITVNKSAVYAIYDLTYLRDVSYKPEEWFFQTRKCEPDAGFDVVNHCERLRDDKNDIIEHTEPICCPCGDGAKHRRKPSSCGNIFDKIRKGKVNIAHCLRFTGDWFHVFAIGRRSIGFSVRIEVKTEFKSSEVIVGPENRTAISSDNFLKASLIGDYVGYESIPSFDNFYLVIPRQGSPGQPQDLGRNISRWMLLEGVRFTLNGLECNKIGVGYKGFKDQPDFCSAPISSCLQTQLWNFWEADQIRISRELEPLYCLQGRFQRINQHPGAGSSSFSIGITEVFNTNLKLELSADDIEYVYQRSPGKIVSVTVPTFEVLTQFGNATITTKNIGEVEASYSLTFDCSTVVRQMEEQFYIMKPKEVTTRSFKLYAITNQSAKYVCSAILKDSDFSEVDRAECQFTTTPATTAIFEDTDLANGPLIPSEPPPKTNSTGISESTEMFWNKLWEFMADFITGKTCRMKCSDFFDFHCHIQYICMSWILMFGLLLAILPTVVVLFWLLHQKGLFDPLYDCWEDHTWTDEQRMREIRKHGHDADLIRRHHHRHKHDAKKKRRSIHNDLKHNRSEWDSNDYHYYLHHVHKDKHKHGRTKSPSSMQKIHLDQVGDDFVGHRRRRKERETVGGIRKNPIHIDDNQQEHHKQKHERLDDRHYKMHATRRV